MIDNAYKMCALVSAILMPVALPAATPPRPPNAAEARALLATLIGIDSTHAHGSTGAAQAIEQALRSAGFPAADIELIRPAPDKGNLLVRFKGKTAGPPVLFLGHLDVVEAKPEDWSVPPFELTERAGYLYGRGTQDMKGDVAASVAALIRLHREGFVPDRDLYFAYTSDEEAGGSLNGVEWLMAHRSNLRQAAYAINFDAGGGDSEQGRPLLMRLQTSEKLYASFEIETTGPGAHSSLPTPDNPIYRLAHGLLRVEAYQFPMHLTATARGYFAGLAPTESGERRADLEAVAKSGDAAAAARLSTEAEFNAMLRTTCVATEISGGHAENALPQRARATLQCRLIPGESPAAVQDKLTELAADPGIVISPMGSPTTSPESAIDPAVAKALRAVTESLWPGTPVVPSMDTGADDSVYTRNAGIPSFGISGLFNDLDDVRAHGRDERVRSRDYDADVEFHYRFYRALGRGR